MPQHYNGIVRPHADGLTGTGHGSISDHATDVANDIFDGDMTRVVFGFCITNCLGSTTGAQAASVMTELATYHSCNGGAFFGSLKMTQLEIGFKKSEVSFSRTKVAQL
jgi:hypothetical protein